MFELIRVCFVPPIILILVISSLAGCGKNRETVHRAFYEWRSGVSFSEEDINALKSLSVDRLYLRLFDVQWHEEQDMPYPESVLQTTTPLPSDIEIIPTIYVTNDVMKRVNQDHELEELARRTANKITEMMRESGNVRFDEVQIDCDWTARSRTSYFKFLRTFAQHVPDCRLSATIRLHQIKYRVETGVPPVDRGMLMAYNVGNVTAQDETNSIFTQEEVEKYIGNLDEYPLSLDVALPLFSWGVRFHFNKFASLIDNLDAQQMRANAAFKEIKEHHFMATRSTELNGESISAGDVIRLEIPNQDEVLSIAREIAGKIGSPEITLALYRFDPAIIERYNHSYFEALFGAM